MDSSVLPASAVTRISAACPKSYHLTLLSVRQHVLEWRVHGFSPSLCFSAFPGPCIQGASLTNMA